MYLYFYKTFLFSALLTFSFTLVLSCGSKNIETKNLETIKADDLSLGPIVHDTLSTEQMEKIKIIYSTFIEVNKSSLEETVTNFKRDQHPDREIQIWLYMSDAYKKFIQTQTASISIDKKLEAYKLILLCSMMPGEEAAKQADLKLLNEKEIEQILSYYTETPEPIKVQKK